MAVAGWRRRVHSARPPQWWAVAGVVAALVALSGTLAVLAGVVPVPVTKEEVVGYLVLTALGVVAEVFVLHVQVKREAQTSRPERDPAGPGPHLCGPRALVAGFVTGAAPPTCCTGASAG